jgi:hypothetical protein
VVAGGLEGAASVVSGCSQSATPIPSTTDAAHNRLETSEQFIVGVLITENALKREMTIRPARNWNANSALPDKLCPVSIV